MGKQNQIPVILYMHAGSGNHGCEAIADSTCRMLYEQWQNVHLEDNLGSGYLAPLILSNRIREDQKYALGGIVNAGHCVLLEENHIREHKLTHTAYYIWRKLTGDQESFQRYRFRAAFAYAAAKADKSPVWKHPLAVSIGGDNYCYPEMVHDLALANSMFRKKGCKTILMGCSIEPDSLRNPEILQDLHSYSKIIARESITFQALLDAGIPAASLHLCPDPAFLLPAEKRPLPEGFEEGGTVGINLSPMVQHSEKVPGVTIDSYRALIRHILKHTNYRIALIPHVVWKNNDDRIPLQKLYDEFRDSKRVLMIQDHSAEELKGYIARCTLFVGARTHATIAAYASCVPTLVLGYSVKSRGIATDLFGTAEHYVIPVQDLETTNDLVAGFEWLRQNQDQIHAHLVEIMPAYAARARENVKVMMENGEE